MQTKSILRSILVLSLIFSTAFAPIANATSEATYYDPAEVTSARFHEALHILRMGSLDWMRGTGATSEERETARKNLQKGLAKKLADGAIHQVEEAGQTIVLVGVLTGVQVVSQEVQKAHLEGKSIDPKFLEQLILKAVEHLLTDGGLYTAMVSSQLLGTLGDKPLLVLKNIIENEGSRKIFAGLLQSGISSFIASVGWEAGAELWTQATHLIPNDKDFERSKNFPGLLAGAARGNSDDKRVLGLLLNNMGQILLFNDDLRAAWIYNTWRLHVATGNFVVHVGAMVTAGAIGTALFPGAGTLAGIMFGAVGGIVTNAVPDDFKEGISDGLRMVRSSADEGRLREDRQQIEAWLEQQLTASDEDFQGILKMQASMRSHVMTAFSEADFKRRSTIQALQHEAATASQTLLQLKRDSRPIAVLYSSSPQGLEQSLQQTIKSDTAKIEQKKADIQQIEIKMRDFYASEISDMAQLMKTASQAGSDNIAQAIKIEIGRLSLVLNSLGYVVREGVKLKDRDLSYWIQASNLNGFNEDRLITALKSSNAKNG